MEDFGVVSGTTGLDRIVQEIHTVLASKDRAVVAISGLPASGKSRLAKAIARFGIGRIPRADITVLDDNIHYTTRFWKLKWTKIQLDKSDTSFLFNKYPSRLIVFSIWTPSKFISFADILIQIQVDESERIARIHKRHKHSVKKFNIQVSRTTCPIVEPFQCSSKITFVNTNDNIFLWSLNWMFRRIFNK